MRKSEIWTYALCCSIYAFYHKTVQFASRDTVGMPTGGEISDMVTPIALAFSTAGQIS